MQKKIIEAPQTSEFWEQLVANLLEKAKQKGATQAEVSTSLDNGFSINVRSGQVETLEYHRGKNLGVTVYFDQRQGTATTCDITPESLDKTIDAACEIAKAAGKDEFTGLAEKAFLAHEYPELSLCHPWPIQAEEGIEIARACEAYALSQDKRIKTSEGVHLSTQQGLIAYGNSNGFLGSFQASSHSLSCHLLVQSEEGMERNYDYTIARDPADLASIQDVAKSAVNRTLRRLHPRRVNTQQVPVLFDATVANGLFASLISAISGGSQYRKASFLLDSLGKTIFPSFVQIDERPHLIKGIGSAPFDSDGVKTADRNLITDGVLQGYVLSVYSARKLGMSPTGNAGGVHNVFVAPGSLNQKALLKQLHKGLWITEMMGQGTNIVTGDYSRGASGFWVENGEVLYPVHEITIAGNLKDMFQHIVAIGNDVDPRRNIRTGSVLIEGMMVGGE